ncbi:MAG TPA: hypothetical protein VK689_20800 [Armatimonadota bacterium]|nr:hypothetical protein [Armatimonadota bacterium]
MVQPTVTPTPPAKGAGSRPVSPRVLVLVLVLFGAIAAGAYWQEEIRNMIAIQAWDTASPKRVVTEYIQHAHAPDNSRLASILSSRIFTLDKAPQGQIKTVKWASPMGVTTITPEQSVPKGEPKVLDAVINKSGEKSYFNVVTQFANGKWGVFRVERLNGKPVITEVPVLLVAERPKDLSFY